MRSRSFLTAALSVLAPAACLAHEAVPRQVVDATREIAESPRDAALRLKRGELHRELGDTRRALRDYDEALRLDPDLLEAHRAAALALLEAGDGARALERLAPYLACRPGERAGRRLHGRILAALGRHAEAARELDLVAGAYDAAEPPPPEVFLERAASLALAGPGGTAAALGSLDEGTAILGPLHALQSAALALELEASDLDAALVRVDGILSRAIRKEEWLARRADLLEAMGRPADARRMWSESLHAIGSVPASRRMAPALKELRQRVLLALARLDGEPGGDDGQGPGSGSGVERAVDGSRK